MDLLQDLKVRRLYRPVGYGWTTGRFWVHHWDCAVNPLQIFDILGEFAHEFLLPFMPHQPQKPCSSFCQAVREMMPYNNFHIDKS